MLLRKGVLKICCKFAGEHPCQSAISMKLICNFIKITLRHGCSSVNLLLIFRPLFLKSTSWWLLLEKKKSIIYENQEFIDKKSKYNIIHFWTSSLFLMLGRCYVKVCSVPLLFLTLQWRMRVLFIIYYFWNILLTLPKFSLNRLFLHYVKVVTFQICTHFLLFNVRNII